MRAELGYLTRRERGAPARRAVEIDAPVLRAGRSDAGEIVLPDLRVGLVAAELDAQADGLRLRATGATDIRVNGKPVRDARLAPGDEIRIGPYRLALEPPGPGVDVALAIELVDAAEDDLRRLRRTSVVGLEATRLGKRLPSWILFLLVVTLGLALPIVSFVGWGPQAARQAAEHPVAKPAWTRVADLSWNVGEVSDAHKHFSASCGDCHRKAFASVPDQACLACHAQIPAHASANAARSAGLDTAGCGDCHTEHRGANASVLRDDRLCTDCHRETGGRMAETGLRPVASFPDGHPAFRVTVLKDAAGPVFERVDLTGGPAPPRSLATLKFPHDAHLKQTGVLSPSGLVKLDCGTCHEPDAGRLGFRPIAFATDCASCHSLKFDPKAPGRSVPHGDPKAVRPYLEDVYSRLALDGGDAEAPSPVARLRVGQTMTEADRLEIRQWVRQRVDAALGLVFDPRRGCGACHIATTEGGSPSVAPVVILDSHLPKTRFDHGRHDTMECGQCHKAGTSAASSDVLMPDLDTCVACHGAADAARKVPSTCISCHDFHRHGLGPMAKTRQEP